VVIRCPACKQTNDVQAVAGGLRSCWHCGEPFVPAPPELAERLFFAGLRAAAEDRPWVPALEFPIEWQERFAAGYCALGRPEPLYLHGQGPRAEPVQHHRR
jgi:hypothetical protein